MKGIAVAVVSVLCLGSASGQQGEPELPFDRPLGERFDPAFHIHAGWESRYVSEGRDNLDGDGLLTGTFEAGWRFVSIGAWYANSPEQAYDELQLNLSISHQWGDLEGYLGYTHVRLPFVSAHDHEPGAGLSWSGLPWELAVGIDGYYSVDAEGSFFEWHLGGDYEVLPCLTLSPAMTFGVNQGYVPDGHDGANHLALHLGAEYQLRESLLLEAHLSYSWGIDRDRFRPGDDQLGDFFHGGVGLSWHF